MSTKTQSRTASRFSAKTLTMCAIFTALVAVCSQITIPLPLIPINLALFAVYLAGALLGPWRGALSLLVYLLCWLLGGLVGLGTLICAFCLGPFIQFFDRTFSQKVLQYKPNN